MVSSWVKTSMDTFFPSQKYQVEPQSSPCSAAIAHRNHYFWLYQHNNSHHNIRLFIAACNKYKRVLEGAKSLFTQRIKYCIASKNFDFHDYWWICNIVLNKYKFSIPPFFNQFEVLIFSADEAECFTRKFFSNSTLNSSGVSLIFNLDPQKACGPDGILVIVIKKCDLELASSL